MRIPWSEKETEILRKLWNNPAINYEEICLVLRGRTAGAVRSKIREMGLPSPQHRLTSAVDEEMLRKLLEPEKI